MNIGSTPRPYFVFPDARTYTSSDHAYRGAYATYAQYNYLRPGFVSWLKRRRFEVALRMAKLKFHNTSVLDFGCGDGVLLPSLARYFPHVIGVDRDTQACAVAQQMVRELALTNVEVHTSTVGALTPYDYRLAFVMETIEHACSPDTARMALLHELMGNLAPDAELILSIPRTTGLLFLLKYIAQRLSGITDEPLTFGEAWRAGIWADTRALEPRWQGGHVGFNNRTFARALFGHFVVLEQRQTLLSVVYRMRERSARSLGENSPKHPQSQA